jgi:uncharacterized protein (DUF4415 family)
MKRQDTGTNWEKLRAKKDSEIDKTDIPELDGNFFKTAKVVIPQKKECLTIRIDKDIVRFFKKRGKGYQTRINAVLRSYVSAHLPG